MNVRKYSIKNLCFLSFGGKQEVICKIEHAEKTGHPLKFIKKCFLIVLSSVPQYLLSTHFESLPKNTPACFIPVHPFDKAHHLQSTKVTNTFL